MAPTSEELFRSLGAALARCGLRQLRRVVLVREAPGKAVEVKKEAGGDSDEDSSKDDVDPSRETREESDHIHLPHESSACDRDLEALRTDLLAAGVEAAVLCSACDQQ